MLYVGLVAKDVDTGGVLSTIQGGLFKSTDEGASWARLDASLPQLNVWDIVVDPNHSGLIYTAVSGGYDHTLGVVYPGGVYKSIDGGTTWSLSASGMGNPIGLDVQAIALSPADALTLYAVTSDAPFHDESSGRGIFVSHNGAGTWSAINEGAGILDLASITVDPSHPSRLYAGTSGNGLLRGQPR